MNKYSSFIAIILLFAALAYVTEPRVAFAAPVGFSTFDPLNSNVMAKFRMHTEGEAEGGDPTDATLTGETSTVEGAETEQPKSLQEIAQKNADDGMQLVEEGKTAPNIPATSANLARFQNRDKLQSEEERKALEPQETDAAKAERQRNEQSQPQTEEA